MKIIKWIWQLPQNIIGFFMSRRPVCTETVDEMVIYYTRNVLKCGVCLGDYILLDYDNFHANGDILSERHEIGHHKQSLILGPLYLIVVGIPSVIRNRWDVIAHRKWTTSEREVWYYNSWPENNADKLGKVNRFGDR